jgi:hypothetical protein
VDAVAYFIRHNSGHVPIAHFIRLKRRVQQLEDELAWEKVDPPGVDTGET